MALQEEMEMQGNWLFRYRSVLPIGILFIGAFIYIRSRLQHHFYSNDPRQEFYFELFCLAVGLLGLVIRILTVGYTPANTSGRNTAEGQLADYLNTTGIYSIMRHPLYVGNFFMWFGIALLTANLWFIITFILVYWLYYERIMFAEEQFLRKKFGHSYLAWSQRTPAIIPCFRNFEKPKMGFSWKKVLRNEKNGLAALFTIFFLFKFIGDQVTKSESYNYFFLGACIFSLVTYAILKYLKRNTTVLSEEGRTS